MRGASATVARRTSPTPARTYSTTGAKTVTLTVTDDQGATAAATQVITVDAALLSPPTGLKKTSGTTSGKRYIDLQFNSVSGATQYEVVITCVTKGCTDVWSNTGGSSPIRISGLQNKTLSYDAQVRSRATAPGSGAHAWRRSGCRHDRRPPARSPAEHIAQ